MELPYGLSELRATRCITESHVRCHVAGCGHTVARQRKVFVASDACLCPHHGGFLSPSTYQYQCQWRNLLWQDDSDRALLRAIEPVKRTMARLGRERDEDALTWNVVRAFQREGRARRLVKVLLGGRLPDACREREPSVIYWGAHGDGGPWEPLARAQCLFQEMPGRGSEPDVLFWWPDQCLAVVEAKFCTSNETRPSAKPAGDDPRPKAYGGSDHFQRVFRASYDEITCQDAKYELMRLWLLGSWIAQEHGASFYLVNLVRQAENGDIVTRFGARCVLAPDRTLMRATWESIWEALPASDLPEGTAATLDRYFADKSAGYGADGSLQRAFTPAGRRGVPAPQ